MIMSKSQFAGSVLPDQSPDSDYGHFSPSHGASPRQPRGDCSEPTAFRVTGRGAGGVAVRAS